MRQCFVITSERLKRTGQVDPHDRRHGIELDGLLQLFQPFLMPARLAQVACVPLARVGGIRCQCDAPFKIERKDLRRIAQVLAHHAERGVCFAEFRV